jgi:N-acetylmuramic acid 6-phosphate etherase
MTSGKLIGMWFRDRSIGCSFYSQYRLGVKDGVGIAALGRDAARLAAIRPAHTRGGWPSIIDTMLEHLTTESRNPASENLDEMSALQIAQLINREDGTIAAAIAKESPRIARAIDIIADCFRNGGRLIYIGAGTSGRLGVLDAAECPPTFSSDPSMVLGMIAGGNSAMFRAVEGAEDHPQLAEEDLKKLNFSASDVLVGIASSGRTPYVLGGLKYARSIGAVAIGVTCNKASEMEPASDVLICPVVGPEILSGSTRMKAGTATKMILNTLTTGAMVRIGKTYGNLMVDLSATNEKLKSRSLRLVKTFTGLEDEPAAKLLAACGGRLKNAIVAHCCNVPPAVASERLRKAEGHLSTALEDAKCPPLV